MALDVYLFHLLNNLAGQRVALDQIIVFIAHYLPYALIGLFVVLVLFFHLPRFERWYLLGETLFSACVARFGVTELIRLFIHRPRPFLAEYLAHPLFTDPAWSFPSGHATFFFALATTIYLYNKKWGIVFLGAAVLVSLGRVAAGVHYPSDIVAGALVGTLVAYGVYMLGRAIRERGRATNGTLT